MEAVIGLLAILIFILVCKKLSSFFFRAAEHFEEKEQSRLYNERCIRESLEGIRSSIAPLDKGAIDYRENLLQANQKISEKSSLSEAMKNELGIM
jgi:uncharacterized membrane protein YhiD involved in acid resistance